MYPLAARTLRLLLVVTALSAVVLHAMEPTLTSTTDIELGRWIQPIVYERRKRETVIRERLEAVQATRNDIERAAAYVLTMLNLTNVTEDLRNYSRDAINTALDSIQANLESEMRRNVERYLAWLGDGSPDVELAQLFRFSWAQAYQDYLQRHRDEPPPYRTSRNNFAPLADPVDWARSVIIRPMRSYSAMTLKVQYVPGPLSGVTVADECTNATAAEDRAAMKDALLQRHYKRLRETVADALDPNVEMLPFSERLGSFVQGLQNKSSSHRPSGRIVGSVVVVSTRRWANVRQFADVILKPDAILQAWNIYYAKRAIPHPLIEPYDFLMTVADELTLAASANAGNLTGLQRLIFEPDSSRTRRQFFDVSLLGLPPYDQLPLDSWWNNGTVREFVHDRIHRFVDGSNKTSYLHSREKLHLVTELKMGSAFTGVINFYSRRRIDPRTQDEGFTSDATVRAQMHFSMFLSSLTGKTSLAAETAERLAQLASRADYDVNFDIVSLGHSVRTSPVGLEELIAKMNTYDAGTFTASGSGESESTMQARRQSNMASVIEAAIKALNGVAQSDPAVSLRSFSAALEDFAQREEQEGVGVPIGFRVQSFTRLDVLAMLASDTVLPEWRNFVGPSLNALPPTAYARLRNMVLQRALQFADNQTVTPLP